MFFKKIFFFVALMKTECKGDTTDRISQSNPLKARTIYLELSRFQAG